MTLPPKTGPNPTTCFFVQAEAEPGTLPRLLELFAKRGLVPDRVHSHVAHPVLPAKHERQHVDLETSGLDEHEARCVAEAMRQIPTVELVLTSAKVLAETA